MGSRCRRHAWPVYPDLSNCPFRPLEYCAGCPLALREAHRDLTDSISLQAIVDHTCGGRAIWRQVRQVGDGGRPAVKCLRYVYLPKH